METRAKYCSWLENAWTLYCLKVTCRIYIFLSSGQCLMSIVEMMLIFRMQEHHQASQGNAHQPRRPGKKPRTTVMNTKHVLSGR